VGQGKDEIVESPAQIREAIARARDELGTHLSALVNPQSPSGEAGDKTMPTEERSKRAGAKSEKNTSAASKKTSAKTGSAASANAKSSGAKSSGSKSSSAKSSGAKSSGAKSRKQAPARVAKDAASKAGRVLDTMAAGAVVGAVKAAAQALSEKKKAPRSTGKVLGEMAPDAAVGAVVGAAQAVMPDGAEVKKSKGKSTKGAKRGTTQRK